MTVQKAWFTARTAFQSNIGYQLKGERNMIDSYFSRFRFVDGSRKSSSVHRSDWRSFGQILYHLKSKHDNGKTPADAMSQCF